MLALVRMRMRMRMRGGAPACALTKRRNIEEEGAGARLFVRGADVTDNLAGRKEELHSGFSRKSVGRRPECAAECHAKPQVRRVESRQDLPKSPIWI